MTSQVTFDLTQQTAFITGATSGFGARFAEILSDAGAHVVISAAEKAAGPISILVNNAGLNVQSSVTALSEEHYNTLMNTNVKGAFFVAQAVGARMLEQKIQGRIVNIASIGALKALPGLVAYSMSKAAVAMMTKGLAREWAKHHIAVNAICPGFIETEINDEWFKSEGGQKQIATFPRRRIGREEDLDATLLLLCSRHASFITGSLITVDDGQLLG